MPGKRRIARRHCPATPVIPACEILTLYIRIIVDMETLPRQHKTKLPHGLQCYASDNCKKDDHLLSPHDVSGEEDENSEKQHRIKRILHLNPQFRSCHQCSH